MGKDWTQEEFDINNMMKRAHAETSTTEYFTREFEMFNDNCYYNMWCVREVHDKNFESVTSFHFMEKKDAELFLALTKMAK